MLLNTIGRVRLDAASALSLLLCLGDLPAQNEATIGWKLFGGGQQASHLFAKHSAFRAEAFAGFGKKSWYLGMTTQRIRCPATEHIQSVTMIVEARAQMTYRNGI
jgi:hypothetical protein